MTAATARASPPPCTAPPSVRWETLPCPNRNAPRMSAARARQERAQLRYRERAADADQTEGRPEAHDDERIGDEPGDRGGCAEDPATDRDADDERRSAGEPDDAAEIARR